MSLPWFLQLWIKPKTMVCWVREGWISTLVTMASALESGDFSAEPAFLCILVRREELLASPYRGPSNKPHISGNLTVFWIGEKESIACHWWRDLSHWQAGRPRPAGLEKRMLFDTGLDAATATSLLMYVHSRFRFHSTSVLLPEYWLYKRGSEFVDRSRVNLWDAVSQLRSPHIYLSGSAF